MLTVFRLLKKSQWLPFDWDIQARVEVIRLYSSVAIGVVIAQVLFNGPYILEPYLLEQNFKKNAEPNQKTQCLFKDDKKKIGTLVIYTIEVEIWFYLSKKWE